MSFSFDWPRRITSLNALPDMRPASRIHAISADDLTERISWSVGARDRNRSSRVRKGRYRETLVKNRDRGLISSEMDPNVVGKEM
jgi:hypothetical protein